jgi:hypothetical protein
VVRYRQNESPGPVHDMVRGMGQRVGFPSRTAVGDGGNTIPVAGTDWLAGCQQFIASGAEPVVLRTRTITRS